MNINLGGGGTRRSQQVNRYRRNYSSRYRTNSSTSGHESGRKTKSEILKDKVIGRALSNPGEVVDAGRWAASKADDYGIVSKTKKYGSDVAKTLARTGSSAHSPRHFSNGVNSVSWNSAYREVGERLGSTGESLGLGRKFRKSVSAIEEADKRITAFDDRLHRGITSNVMENDFLSRNIDRVRSSSLLDDVAKYSDEAADGVELAGKFGKRLTPGAVDLAFLGLSSSNILTNDELSDRQKKIRLARAAGGTAGSLVGGAIGGTIGAASSFGLGAPAGAVAGGALGEMAGRKASGWVAKQLVGSPTEESGPRPASAPPVRPIRNTSMPNGAPRRIEIPAGPSASAPDAPASAPANEPNRAKANKQNRQPERVVERHVERRPVPTHDVDRKIEKAKQEAVREMERRFGPRPTQF